MPPTPPAIAVDAMKSEHAIAQEPATRFFSITMDFLPEIVFAG
jgi:hypothetical protein